MVKTPEKSLERKVLLALLTAALALATTCYSDYSHNDRANAQDIGALKAQYTDQDKRLDRIENKVDTIFEATTGLKPPAR